MMRNTFQALLVAATVGVTAVLGATPVLGVDPGNHESPVLQPTYGVHLLIDGGEDYHGVVCRYTAGQLTGFRIRRPLALPVGNAQYIGWRYVVQGTDDADPRAATWTTRFTSPLRKERASDSQPAPFTNAEKALDGLSSVWYRIVIRLAWYEPRSRVDGRAAISVESYENGSGDLEWLEACPSNEAHVSAARATERELDEIEEAQEAEDELEAAAGTASIPPDPDVRYVAGRYGLSLLIDESDDWGFSGAACFYDGGALDRIRIRRPVAFPARRRQPIAWRYRIEGTNDLELVTADWQLVANGPLEKAPAARPQPAPFHPMAFTFRGALEWTTYRVVDRVYWYSPSTGRVEGRTYMAVESYDDGVLKDEAASYTYGCPAAHP